ncbi:MAG: indole-3-glycerol phosphate synthase TrpC [Proteobacteria bacterium]|nr:indole-3-glycerol phosphate synthase TrpC [Pseudomonadota bacterium]MBU4296185.1 indole-3-glycerol phosphate synthase TrpC [Pseudomonadota bacterium]MCG2749647.1 indole-3-glycerol phosphate synthase TrpC [Desulfobulbaceae bacterium]
MILDTIVEQKRLEVKELLAKGMGEPQLEVTPPRGFSKALTAFAGVSLIAEAKKASPSKGVICADFDPVAIARQYEAGGAQAMSVLTDEKFFQGSLAYITQVRAAVSLPVLRKDFMIHEVQIAQAARFGADAILLIAAILEINQMQDFLSQSRELGMDALVEVHDEAELEKALAAGSSLIGINNRNLKDFSMDLETTFRLQREIPEDIPVVSESGIRTVEDIRRLAAAGIAAVLVGETLMRANGRELAVHELMGR